MLNPEFTAASLNSNDDPRTELPGDMVLNGDIPGDVMLNGDTPGDVMLNGDTPGDVMLNGDTPGDVVLNGDTPRLEPIVVAPIEEPVLLPD